MRNLTIIITLLLTFGFVTDASAAKAKKPGTYNDLNSRELVKLLKPSCKLGHMAHCYELGIIYSKGKSSASKKTGKNYVEKSCKGGLKQACDYLKGENVYPDSPLLYWAAIISMGLAVLLVTSMIFLDEEEFKATEKLEEGSASKDHGQHGIVLKYSRPFFKRYLSPVISSMKNKKKIREKYKKKLASAGLTNYLTPEDFLAFKLFLIVGFPIVFMAIRTFLEETWSLNLVPITGAVGFVYPDIWIKGKIEQRQKDVIMAMPFCVDMLALSVEAGLDFIAAMTKVVEKAKASSLSEEFEILIKEIRIGASRAEALRNLSWRIDLIQVSSFCATLIAADSVGASIGPILKALSGEIRQKKSAQVEKAGATAATKILFPMMFLIIPAVFIIVAAPLVLEFMGGGK